MKHDKNKTLCKPMTIVGLSNHQKSFSGALSKRERFDHLTCSTIAK